MKRTYPASRRPLERGQFSWVTMALLLGLASAVYLAYVWVPIYALHYMEVRQATRDFINQAVKNRDDAVLVERLCTRLASLDGVEETDDFGRKVRVPTIQLEPRDITWERDITSTPPMLHVAFEYVRVVKYPWIDRTVEQVMTIDFTSDIAVPKW